MVIITIAVIAIDGLFLKGLALTMLAEVQR